MSHALRIGLGQVAVKMGDKAENCAALLEAVEQAGRAGCDVVVLPECGLAGWLSAKSWEAAEPVPGPFIERLRRAARNQGMAIVAGIEERAGDHVYNSAVFIDEGGELRATHRKINELELARSMYSTGSSIGVTAWHGFSIGLLICADCWRPEFVDALHGLGANLILSPCAWAVDPGSERTNLAWIAETYRQRIGQRDLTIAAANGVGEVTDGPWRGRRLQGNSLVIGQALHVCGGTQHSELVVFETNMGKSEP